MAEENKHQHEKKMEENIHQNKDDKTVETKHEHKPSEIVEKEKKTEVKEEKKKKMERPKKHEAVAYGDALPISKKHGMYICSFIRGKKIDSAIANLQEVLKFKKAVPFKGEIPHRKGKGMMSGRYPISASKQFITLLKGLKGNVIVNGMDLDKTVIAEASSSWASRPARRDSRKGKRSHIILKAREIGGHK